MAQDVPCLPSPAVALYLLGLSEACLKSTCPHPACGQILRRSTVADLARCLARHLENHKPCARSCDTCNTCPVVKTTTARCNMCRSALSARSARDSTSGLCFRCVLAAGIPPLTSRLAVISKNLSVRSSSLPSGSASHLFARDARPLSACKSQHAPASAVWTIRQLRKTQ